MPGRKGSICIASESALNCPPEDVIRRDGLAPAISKASDGPFNVMGVVADSVDSIEITLADGGVTRVAAVENAFRFEATAQPRGLRWLYDGEEHAFEFEAGLFDTPPEWRGIPDEPSEDDG